MTKGACSGWQARRDGQAGKGECKGERDDGKGVDEAPWLGPLVGRKS